MNFYDDDDYDEVECFFVHFGIVAFITALAVVACSVV